MFRAFDCGKFREITVLLIFVNVWEDMLQQMGMSELEHIYSVSHLDWSRATFLAVVKLPNEVSCELSDSYVS